MGGGFGQYILTEEWEIMAMAFQGSEMFHYENSHSRLL